MKELEAERADLAPPASSAIGEGIDVGSLRTVIEARVLEMREAFAGVVAKRAAFRALLGERRLRVPADAEREFRVEGMFELAPEKTTDARPSSERASAIVSSGACNARVFTLPVSLPLPVCGHLEHVAA